MSHCNAHRSFHTLVQVGFLYLRYTCNPRYLWEWVKDYLEDAEVGHAVCCGRLA